MQNLSFNYSQKIQDELSELDRTPVAIDGVYLKPSKCYHIEMNPLHILFNTNCPSSLREKIAGIIKKYYPQYEAGA